MDDLFSERPPRATVEPARLLVLPCKCCGTVASVALDAPARLCDACQRNLYDTKARAQQRFVDAVAAFEAEERAFAAYQSALPADVVRRWAALQDDRTKAQTALNAALRGKYKASLSDADRQRIIDATRQKYERVMAGIEKTKNNPNNPLHAVLAREAQYQAALQKANDDTRAATIALQEIAAAMEDSAV